eukprot:209326-Rhodomonas_salina.1
MSGTALPYAATPRNQTTFLRYEQYGAMRGTDSAYARVCCSQKRMAAVPEPFPRYNSLCSYAMCGTQTAYGLKLAMSGTHLGYAATP